MCSPRRVLAIALAVHYADSILVRSGGCIAFAADPEWIVRRRSSASAQAFSFGEFCAGRDGRNTVCEGRVALTGS